MRGFALLAALILAGTAAAQTTQQEAREEGTAFATEKRGDAALVPDDPSQAAVVPGYAGDTTTQSVYFDNPDRLAADAVTRSSSDEAYRVATDAERTRPEFSTAEIVGATARATAVEKNPEGYLAGEAIDAASRSCTPLPPGDGAPVFYEATCETGTKVETTNLVCRVPLVVDVEGDGLAYRYTCEDLFDPTRRNGAQLCTPFEPHVASGVCRETQRRVVGRLCLQGTPRDCTEPGEFVHAVTLDCAAVVTDRPYTAVPSGRIVGERRDESRCDAATAARTCVATSELCVDAEPATRLVNGLPVTRACLGWERTYACAATSQASTCSSLDRNADCSFLREECLDDPRHGPCNVSQRFYRCPIPDATIPADTQYICGDEVYCINGDCEAITREASTEFKDALVALNAIGQAGAELDPAALTVFSGERATCHHKLFGVSNCCSGKGVPLLTPWLCDAAEKALDEKDDKGLCHRVGSYCSDSVLGICVTTKDAYCCFASKLSRILQEQGRTQVGKPWSSPRTEACAGFSIEEFQRLDLSRMDFTEIYAEFVEAARLPDEVQTVTDIQASIKDYYDLHGG